MVRIVVASVVGLFCLIVGFSAAFKPYQIQKSTIDYHIKYKIYNPSLDWMKTKNYILWLRLAGIVSLAASSLMFYVLYRIMRELNSGKP